MRCQTSCPDLEPGRAERLARRWRAVLASALMGLGVSAVMTGPLPAAEPDQMTAAEKLLFVTDHLANLKAPALLEYGYVRSGSLESEARDTATLALSSENDHRMAQVKYLPNQGGGPDTPPIADAQGNPIILHFLERETREMNRLTKGSAGYFRKRIRMALAGNPAVSQVQARYGDDTVPATLIRITPYVDDPLRTRYEKFANKIYEFTLSDRVPGGVVRLHTELTEPGKDGAAAQTIITETVTLTRQIK